jgi:transglutaminase-like putative cysteine protease
MKKLLFSMFALLATTLVQADYTPSISVQRSITDIHVFKNWTFRQRFEVTKQVETDKGIALLGEQKISYNSAHERVRVIQAYTLQPDGTIDRVRPESIRTQDDREEDGDSTYSETKVKVIIFPNLRVGSQTYYKVESFQHTPDFPKQFEWSHYFSPHLRYKQVEIRFSHAPDIHIQVDTRGMSGGRAVVDKPKPNAPVSYQFTFTQDTAYPRESWMVDLSDFAPYFMASSFKSYADVGHAYQARALPQTRITPEIAALARQLIGSATDPTEKTRKLYQWVAKNIRYLGVYAGSGGYVPHSAASILKNRFGDCKDHVTLLEALLRSVGIESTPALINAERAYQLPRTPGTGLFDHVITYVPSLNLFLDSTARFVPLGVLPSGLKDKPVVLAATGEVMRTPADNVDVDRTEATVKMQVRDDGSIVGNSEVKHHGYFEVFSRQKTYESHNTPVHEVVTRNLARFNESGTGNIKHPEPQNLDALWIIHSNFILDPVVNLPGAVAMTIPIGLTYGKMKSYASVRAPEARRFPTPCGSSGHVELIELTLPPAAHISRIPKNTEFKSTSISYSSSYKLKQNTIVVERQISTQRWKTICEAEDDQEWNMFFDHLKRDLRQQIFLE